MGLLRGRGCEVWEDNGEYGVGVVKRHYSKAREGLALAAVALHQFYQFCIARKDQWSAAEAVGPPPGC